MHVWHGSMLRQVPGTIYRCNGLLRMMEFRIRQAYILHAGAALKVSHASHGKILGLQASTSDFSSLARLYDGCISEVHPCLGCSY